MGLFEQFPYTNYHEKNLAWLISEVRRLIDTDAELDERIAALEAWIDGQNIEQMIDDKLQEMLNNGDFNDIVAQALGVVITPQALGYPGTKTADEAFTILQNFTVNPIAIPEGSYTLSDTYSLKNVVYDQGTYTSYVPLYDRSKNLDLQSFGGETIALPVKESYLEGACFLNNFWYIAVYNYNQSYDLLLKYDLTMTQQLSANMTRPAPDGYSQHASRDVYTDGSYIYVDFTRATFKYDPGTLSLIDTYTHMQDATGYFNGSFWGYTTSGTALVINELNSDFTIKTTHIVDRKVVADQQSMTIHNGLFYFPNALTGFTTIVNMYDWSYNNIWYDGEMEIEQITFKDSVAYYFGHAYGLNGIFTYGPFNGGQAVRYLGRYEFDGNDVSINLSQANKFGIYDFTNFTINPYGNSGKMIIIEDMIYVKIGHYLAVWTGTSWRLCGTDAMQTVNVTSGIAIRIMPSGAVYLWFTGYTMSTSSITTLTLDANDLFDMLGLSASATRQGSVFGRNASNPDPTSGYGGAVATLSRTSLQLRPFTLIGSPANLYIQGYIPILE